MEYVYAALLLHKLNQEVNEENVKKVVAAAGVTPDEVKVKALVSALSEVNIDEVLEAAKAAPVAAAPAAPAPEEKAEEEKKEEEKKEEEAKSEEEALAGLASLFG